MDKNRFLEHIGGLRGVAILLVVLFHLNDTAWPQGYLGVDVFLVISGYLLFRNRLKQETPLGIVDTLRFAWRRIQRIIAPMCIIILLAVGIGILFLMPDGEKFSCKIGETACLVRANMLLAREMSNYFAPDSAYTPLLHLWYLSVTLQVYLIFAVGNYVLQRLPKRLLMTLLSIAGVASLAYYYSSPIHEWLAGLGAPTWKQSVGVSYYATLPRLWEILAGGAVLLLPQVNRRWLCTLVSVGGVIAILVYSLGAGATCCEWLQEPPTTLIAVVSAMLIIRYLPESHLPHLLSNKPLLWVGKISFSVYLVHMPLIVFWRMWEYGNPSEWVQSAMVVASVAVGWAFWWSVEKRRINWWVIILLWVGTYMVCRAGRKMDSIGKCIPFTDTQIELPKYDDWQLCKDEKLCEGWDSQVVPWLQIFSHMGATVPADMTAPFLSAGDTSREASMVLIGDSHALHTYPGLDAALKQIGMHGVYLCIAEFPFYDFYIDIDEPAVNRSELKQQAVFNWLEAHPQITHILIAQRWVQKLQISRDRKWDFETSLRRYIQQLRSMGRKVILVGPTPEFSSIMAASKKILALRGDRVPKSPPACTVAEYREIHKDVLPILKKLENEKLCTILDPLAILKPSEAFKAMDENTMLMLDDNHFSVEGSIRLMKALLPQLREALAKKASETESENISD